MIWGVIVACLLAAVPVALLADALRCRRFQRHDWLLILAIAAAAFAGGAIGMGEAVRGMMVDRLSELKAVHKGDVNR